MLTFESTTNEVDAWPEEATLASGFPKAEKLKYLYNVYGMEGSDRIKTLKSYFLEILRTVFTPFH